MPQTSVQRKSSYYDKIINEKSEVAFSAEYEKVRETLKSLVEYSRELNNPAVKMSPQDHTTLAKRYYAVRTACDEFLKKEIGKDEKSRQGLVEDISRVVKKDLTMLYNCDVTKGVSLSEVIDNARTRKLVITKDAAKTMGGNLSSRIPVKTARDKRGFFTPSVKYNTDAKWTAQVAKFADRLDSFVPGMKTKLGRLTGSDKKKDAFAEIVSTVSYDEVVKEYGRDKAEEQLEVLAVTIGLVQEMDAAKKLLAKNRDLKKTLIGFMDAMAPLVNERAIMKLAGIKKDVDISKRNCAMTDMADLLGCRSLLAESVKMTVEIDGVQQEGVFMETVEGTDVNRLKENDLIFKADKSSILNANVFNQVMDLEVLDFICGNIDRHPGNMIYQFAEKDGKVVLQNIKGIDNDCSFGTPDISKNQNVHCMTHPYDMQYIREKTWDKLKDITKENIELKLAGHHFDKDELEAVWNRVQILQDRVKSNRIQKVDDKFFEGKDLGEMLFNKNTYLRDMQLMGKYLKREYSREASKDYMAKGEIDYLVDDVSKTVMYGKLEKINQLREKMNKARAWVYNSSEFNMMQSRFEKIEKYTKQMQKFGSPEKVPQELAKKAEQAYNDLAERALIYVNLKSLVPSTTNGVRRRDLAQQLMEFADDTIKETVHTFDRVPKSQQEKPKEMEQDNGIER